MKRFVTKLLFVDKVQNEWAKSMIGAISTTVILSLLGLAVTTLYQEVRQLVSEARNISEEEALAVARQNIGVDTVEAIPFRNKDSDLQYIAVGAKTLNNKLQLGIPPRAVTYGLSTSWKVQVAYIESPNKQTCKHTMLIIGTRITLTNKLCQRGTERPSSA